MKSRPNRDGRVWPADDRGLPCVAAAPSPSERLPSTSSPHHLIRTRPPAVHPMRPVRFGALWPPMISLCMLTTLLPLAFTPPRRDGACWGDAGVAGKYTRRCTEPGQEGVAELALLADPKQGFRSLSRQLARGPPRRAGETTGFPSHAKRTYSSATVHATILSRHLTDHRGPPPPAAAAHGPPPPPRLPSQHSLPAIPLSPITSAPWRSLALASSSLARYLP